jgi:hypothetical protein
VIGVESLVEELNTVTPEHLMDQNYTDIRHLAPNFAPCFRWLRRLLSDNTQSQEKHVFSVAAQLLPHEPSLSNVAQSSTISQFISSTTSGNKKRPNSLTIDSSSPLKIRPNPEERTPHTPDRPSMPKNPDYTGDSSESVDEDNTKQMLVSFIDAVLSHLGRPADFYPISWPTYVQNCELDISGSSCNYIRL